MRGLNDWSLRSRLKCEWINEAAGFCWRQSYCGSLFRHPFPKHCDARQQAAMGDAGSLYLLPTPWALPAVSSTREAASLESEDKPFDVSSLGFHPCSLWYQSLGAFCFVLACLKPASLCVHSPPPEAPALASRHSPLPFPEYAGLFLEASRWQ